MTPVRNNREGISPTARAVNDTLLCTEPISILQNCTFLYLKALPQWKIHCIRRKGLFLVHNCHYPPSKRNCRFWGYLLIIILSLLCHCRFWASHPGTRKKWFGGILKEKTDEWHYWETSSSCKQMLSIAVIMSFSKVRNTWRSWNYGHNDCNKSMNNIWNDS